MGSFLPGFHSFSLLGCSTYNTHSSVSLFVLGSSMASRTFMVHGMCHGLRHCHSFGFVCWPGYWDVVECNTRWTLQAGQFILLLLFFDDSFSLPFH
jgi:hypothetical protein